MAASCEVLQMRDDPDTDLRHAGCGVVVDHQLYLWGGVTEDKVTFSDSEDSESDSEPDSEEDRAPPPHVYIAATLPRANDKKHPFDVFDLLSLTWHKQNTIGEVDKDVPNVGIGSSLCYHRDTHSIFLYSGWNEGNFSSDIFCVSLDTWKWEKVVIPEGEIKPSPRYRTGMLVYRNKLCHFGGVGLKIVEGQDKGAKYQQHADKIYGWNNEYYEFDVITRKWEVPLYGQEDRPPVNGGHVFTRFDSHRALCFGGSLELIKPDATYIFDLEKKEFHGPLCLEVRPVHRTFATLCPLVDPDVVGESLCPGGPPMEQTLLLLWGKASPNLILKDCWLLHCSDMKWTKIDLSAEVERYWHVACPNFCRPGKSTEVQVVVYGGARKDPSVAQTQFIGMGGLTVLSFGTKSLKHLCLSAITHALCSHGSTDSDQLLCQLPSTVPTAIKHSIIAAHKACVLASSGESHRAVPAQH